MLSSLIRLFFGLFFKTCSKQSREAVTCVWLKSRVYTGYGDTVRRGLLYRTKQIHFRFQKEQNIFFLKTLSGKENI